MTVYVILKSKPFEEYEYIGVCSSKKNAEKALRKLYPHMKKIGELSDETSYVSDSSQNLLLYIRKEDF